MDTLPRSYPFPLHPETKERWHDREEQINRAWELYADADSEDKPEYQEALDDLREGLEWGLEPYIAQMGILGMPEVVGMAGGPDLLFIHSETWAELPESEKQKYQLCGKNWEPL